MALAYTPRQRAENRGGASWPQGVGGDAARRKAPHAVFTRWYPLVIAKGCGLVVEEPATYLQDVLVKAFKRGVAVIGAGFSTIKLTPPLVIPREVALKVSSIILKVLRGYR